MTEMEEMKVATIIQLINEEAARKGVTEKVNHENLVKLPKIGIQDFYMGVPTGDVYVARIEAYVCLVNAYRDGRIHIFFHPA